MAVRELTPQAETVERTSIKAHKAGLKASFKAQKKGYTPVDDTVERVGLKAALKAEIAAHKASIKAKAAAHKAHKAHKKGNWIYFYHFIEIKFC